MALNSLGFLWGLLGFLVAIFIPHAITCVDLDGPPSSAGGKQEALCGIDNAMSSMTAK